ncbi:sialate O-acetylesterase [Arthrospiribacter ruber]|uniref:Sialate O-acetylesterase n=1 Tax=Arthrospiribacter ruber TaxID=2487934 RepID=A0A951ITQ6_9BACT|nr:sialate O-acetylesterase [Arthrospiribacter ruber]MBW3466454.1 sialate O-acetylesterase [Arthrospiribacter ruber]
MKLILSPIKAIWTIFTLCIFFSDCFADIRLPKLVSTGMVLQRDHPIKIWGWASPEESIQVEFKNKSYNTQADKNGDWFLTLEPQSKGGPYQMYLKGDNEITLEDILIGDIWLASGQSNMEINMQRVSPLYPEDIATADFPQIRYFEVPKHYNFKEAQKDLPSGTWRTINTDNILQIPAVSFFFARNLHQTLDVPIGIVNASLGGSPAEAWISGEAIKKFPDHYQEWIRFQDDKLITQIEKKDAENSQEWYALLNRSDKALHSDLKWTSPDLDDADWKEMEVPRFWKGTDLENLSGSVWFRKSIELDEKWLGKTIKLDLGRIIDADSVFINGTLVGSTSYQYPPRRYEIPVGLLKTGKNTIAIRVISNTGEGGFVPDKPYSINMGEHSIPLSGKWKYKIGAEIPPLPAQTFVRWKPVGLFNAMISPLLPFKFKGVIWYQGESNTARPEEYPDFFKGLIQDWRKYFSEENLPFIYAQLPNYMEPDEEPKESQWAELREAQAFALSLPNTGMAVTIDLGEWNDIHPLNKKDVADRLALQARKVAYQEGGIKADGPVLRSFELEKNRVILHFDHVEQGWQLSHGENPNNFAIAGEDGQYKWANAELKKNKIIVFHEDIPQPKFLRFAWADNPADFNLFNAAGLPTAPFRIKIP